MIWQVWQIRWHNFACGDDPDAPSVPVPGTATASRTIAETMATALQKTAPLPGVCGGPALEYVVDASPLWREFMSWYWFSGWYPNGSGRLTRRYERGPIRMSYPQAVEEYLDTAEVFQGGSALMHRWDPLSGWQLIHGSA